MIRAQARPAYHETEVGLIPIDWRALQVRNVCQLVNGRGFKPHEWSDRGLPIIRIQNLNGSPDFNYFQGRFDPKILVRNGQLLFAWSGSRGTSFGPHIWPGPDAVLNYHTWKVVPNERVTKTFLFYALKSLTALIEDNAHGASALVHMQKWEMEGFYLVVPRLAEQNKVAGALQDVDELIATLGRLIAKKQEIKLGMMQVLLTGRTRLPGFSGKWIARRLRDHGSTYGGLTGKTKEDFGVGQARFVTFLDVIYNTRIVTPNLEQVTVRRTERQNQVLRDDVLFNGSSETPEEVALPAVVDFDPKPSTYLNSFCFGYRLRDGAPIHSAFLANFFRASPGRALVASLAQGATRYNIAKTKFLELAPVLPPLAEQAAVASVLHDADDEIAALRARLEKARAVKQGMMQQLLTGRTRLPFQGTTS